MCTQKHVQSNCNLYVFDKRNTVIYFNKNKLDVDNAIVCMIDPENILLNYDCGLKEELSLHIVYPKILQ